MTTPNQRREGWSERAYRAALHAFPADLRARWTSEMQATFAARLSAARAGSASDSSRIVLREIASVIASGILGITRDVPYGDPLGRLRRSEAVYLPWLQNDVPYAVVLARHRAGEMAGREALLRTFAAVDPLLIPDGLQPMPEVFRNVWLIATSVSIVEIVLLATWLPTRRVLRVTPRDALWSE
jgi:hypothetical protein